MRWLTFLLAAGALCAQNSPIPGITDSYNRYHAIYSNTLSSATDSVTVQQNASASLIQVFESAVIQCSATCVFTFYQNGTTATSSNATAFTMKRVGNAPAPQATAWNTSSVATTGTQFSTFTITGGGQETFDLSKFQTTKAGNSQNLTVAFASMSGTISVDVQLVER